MQNNCSKNDVTYAGFWVRFFAYVIDSVIVFFALLIIRLTMAGVMALMSDTALGGNILFQYTLTDIVLYIAQVIYFILFIYSTGTTPGKRLMNLRVVSADGQKLTLLNVVYREVIGRFLCGLFLGIGYIVAGVDKQKRGVHDMLSDTRVIYGKKVKVYPIYQAQAAPPQNMPQGEPSYRPPVPSVPRQVTTPMPQDKPPQGGPHVENQGMPPQGGQYRMVPPKDSGTQERDS